MPKRSKKSKSKRLTLRQKHKILKKVKEHHKKKRKELKKSGKAQKAPKDPGIPSQWPFKEELLKEFAWQKQKILMDEKNKREERKRAREDVAMDSEEGGLEALTKLRAAAANKAADFEARKKARLTDTFDADKDKSRKAFYKEFRRVVESADVVIQVLDARDPLACRCPDIERYIRSLNPNKRIILLLNKIDLVPREVAVKWLQYFREELPAVAFKCSTQAQATNMSQKAGGLGGAKGGPGGKAGQLSNAKTADEGLHGSGCLGASTLLQLLKNYTRNQGVKTAITVGVVGLPNVGKSSLINSLIRSKVAQVGNTPGVTRAVQEVHLDKHIRLLDSPGVVFSSAGSDSASILRNCVRVEALPDPVTPVAEILQRVPAKQLMTLYRIPTFTDTDQFLQHIAGVRGKLKKGGTPDIRASAKIVLQDWNNGKIPFFTLPPARTAGEGHESAAVVGDWSTEFDAEAVFAEGDKAVLQELQEEEEGRFIQMQSVGGASVDMVEMMAEDEEEEDSGEEEGDDMEESDEEERGVQHKAASSKGQQSVLYSEAGQYNPHAARAEKKRAKKMKGVQLPSAEGEEEEEDFDWEEGNADLRAAHKDDGMESSEGEESGSDDDEEDDEEGQESE